VAFSFAKKPMFNKPQSKSSTLWRIADVACALLVIFYILFDVLDLDGSNVCRIGVHRDYSAMVGEADADFRLNDSLKLTSSQSAVIPLVGQNSIEFADSRRAKASAFPLSVAGRSHGDRGCRQEHTATDTSPDH
jgi:hypothetical protein